MINGEWIPVDPAEQQYFRQFAGDGRKIVVLRNADPYGILMHVTVIEDDEPPKSLGAFARFEIEDGILDQIVYSTNVDEIRIEPS